MKKDDSYFTQIFKEHYPYVFKVVSHVLKDPQHLHICIQDVFVEFHHNMNLIEQQDIKQELTKISIAVAKNKNRKSSIFLLIKGNNKDQK